MAHSRGGLAPCERGAQITYPASTAGSLVRCTDTQRSCRMGGKQLTAPTVRSRKGSGIPLVMLTAYDAPGACMAHEAGVDMILVGDSLAMVVLGYDDTLQVTVADLAHHTAAVTRAKPSALIVGDLPWLSYHVSVDDTVRNAAELIRAGAQCVKLEGGRKRLPMIEALV